MSKKYLQLIILFLLITGFITSCKVIQPYRAPQVRTEGLYRDSTTTDTNTIASLHWNEIFTDTILQSLITEGIAQNLDLKIAYTRIEQARAYYEQSRLAFFPSLNANASGTLSRLSDAQSAGRASSAQQYQLGLTSSWEANIWGQLSSTRRANLATLLQNEAASRAVQTSLIANIANYYYSLLALDQQLAITQQTVQYWDTTVVTMRALKEADVVTGAAVVQSEASRYAAAVTIPDIRQDIRQTENALSILLARPSGAIRRSTLDDERPIEVLQTGIPAQLLANRPDVQEAEYNFRYYFELTNVARTYFYPALTITASGGLSSLTLGNFFNGGSIFGNLVGGLAQPIFSQGINRARLRSAQAQQQQALFNFQNVLLTAGREVSDALSSYQTALDKAGVRSNQLSALQQSVAFSQELLRYGFANYTEVLTARQSLLGAQLSSVNDRLQQLQAIVNLYNALGGGWK